MKTTQKKWLRRIVVLLLLIVAIFLLVSFLIRPAPEANSEGPYFVFDNTSVKGWRAGLNNFPVDTPPPEYEGDTEALRYTIFNLFQGTQSTPGSCFVTFLYSDVEQGSAASILDASKQRVTSGYDDLSIKEITTSSEAMRAFDRSIEYKLHSYELTGSPGANIARGMQFGYVQLDDGYVEIRGVCDSPSELDATSPVLSTVELKNS